MVLLLAILTIGGNLFAQCPQQFAIEICESELQTAPQGAPDGNCADNCHSVFYWVYLTKPANPLSTSDETIEFTNFHLTGTLNVIPNQNLGGAGLSEVNVKKSITCSPEIPGLNEPGTPNSPLISYNANSNAISYEISSTNYGNQLVNLGIQGRTLLFVLAVDVFPGESVQPAAFSCLIQFANNPNPCFPPVLGCNSSGDPAFKTLPQPTTACSNGVTGPPTLKMDEYAEPLPGYPNRKLIPVYMAGVTNNINNFDFSEIDFLMTFTSSQSMYVPTIESGRIPKESVKVYPFGTQYRIYAQNQSELSIEQSSTRTPKNILFYIVLNGPVYESECAVVTVSFTDYARMEGGDFSCCRPNRGAPEIVEWTSSNCVPIFCTDITIGAYKTPPVNSTLCNNNLIFEIWASSTQNNYHLTGSKIVVDIQKSGTLTYIPAPTTWFDPSMIATVNVTEMNANLLRMEIEMHSGLILVTPAQGRRLMGAVFSGDNACIEAITFRDAVATYAANPLPDISCITTVSSAFKSSDPGDDICVNSGVITAVTENGEPISGWTYYTNRHANYTDCPKDGIMTGATSSTFCTCPEENLNQNVALLKTLDPLNGVNTYDLILISRHILNFGPIAGLKLLAADANLDGKVTTFDVVELRKLILGTYAELPYVSSWRFLDKNIYPLIETSNNPFLIVHPFGDGSPNSHGIDYPTIPTSYKFGDKEFAEYRIPPTSQMDGLAEFVGFKVGDVDQTATPENFVSGTEDRTKDDFPLGIIKSVGKKNNIIEIPVVGLNNFQASGWQLSLNFDPGEVVIEGVQWAASITSDNSLNKGWNIPDPGELRLLWFEAEEKTIIESGVPLFVIKVRLLKDITTERPLFCIADNSIPGMVFSPVGEIFKPNIAIINKSEVKYQSPTFKVLPNPQSINIYPNPTSGHFRIEIQQEIPAVGTLSITDVMGRTIYTKVLDLLKNSNTITSIEVPTLCPGQYAVWIETSTGISVTRLIKQ